MSETVDDRIARFGSVGQWASGCAHESRRKEYIAALNALNAAEEMSYDATPETILGFHAALREWERVVSEG